MLNPIFFMGLLTAVCALAILNCWLLHKRMNRAEAAIALLKKEKMNADRNVIRIGPDHRTESSDPEIAAK